MLLRACLLSQVFKVQPQYAKDLWETGSTLSSNLHDVQQTCQQASDGLRQDGSSARLLTGLSGMQFEQYSRQLQHPAAQ